MTFKINENRKNTLWEYQHYKNGFDFDDENYFLLKKLH